ncbi:hypothetical protein [Bacillus cereus]|uniref:hypothetical protein n=1 Tax=Bacillus cereus TaxID=1396 RepID=UPI0010BE71D8|nr:hypothetical protein [Bacillus cereus]TKH23824.1 hypothetical protein FC690_26275 [Bacillus cereus]
MGIKEGTETEVSVKEVPQLLKEAIEKKTDYDILSIVKVVSYPYKEKERESVAYKAYLLNGNIMTLLEYWDVIPDEVREDSMIAGDIFRMAEFWNKHMESMRTPS